ncbi:MAG TPA: TRIC cation channel family protein [Actinomycetota bacterium]|nr:TRIC cation channel family protein [Actinomycetota bacterium]
MEPTAIPLWLDLLAVGVGAVFGGALTNRRGAPMVGVLLAGVVLGLGGGIMRDLMLSVRPVAVSNPWFVTTAAACALLGGLLARRLSAESGVLVLLDAWALAMFVVIGAGKAMTLGVSPPVGVFLGMVTAIGGGTLVDLMTGEIPTVMAQGPWYTSAALLGSGYFVAMWLVLPRPVDEWSTIVLLVLVRFASVKRGWDAPNVDDLRRLRLSRGRSTPDSGR